MANNEDQVAQSVPATLQDSSGGSAPVADRPATMGMAIQSGILKSLGINLYTNLGKVLVEFIANAYDSDATKVTVTVPVDRIAAERTKRADEASGQTSLELSSAEATSEASEPEAEKAAEADIEVDTASVESDGSRATSSDGSTVSDGAVVSTHKSSPPLDLATLFDTLPDDIEVIIEDDGHGMTWRDVETKFLPLNRQRRISRKTGKEDDLTSPGGRYVMGRKGVGKLAGFGAALTVTLWTKRKGERSATVITLVDEDLNQAGAIQNLRIPVTYEDGLPEELQGTRVTLSRLKADATRDSLDKIKRVVEKSFHAIRPEDFKIVVNDKDMVFELPDYEFIYPETLTRAAIKAGTREQVSVTIPGVGDLPFSYYVGFLPRSHGSGADRGATIYCNNRLAAGPALFGLPTGMHSFHSVDYMDCIIEADVLDRTDIDFINTARNGIKEGNEVVGAMLEGVVGVMKKAIAAHAKFKKTAAEKKLSEDPTAKIIKSTIEALPRKTRKAGRKLLQTIAETYEVGTPEFEELAPVIVHSINATEVLIKLVSHGTDVDTIGQILDQLRQLSEIEKRDSLKLYRARRGGIEKLELMYERGRADWKTKQFEKDLHLLFKENPWLIRPEFSGYISSDHSINTTVSRVARDLGVDEYAPIVDGDDPSDVRPDLVFLMSDPMEEGPYTIKIVELKSPALPLTIEHWRQLEDYVAAVEEWCRTNLSHAVRVNGYLIGSMPKPSPSVASERRLLDKFRETGPNDPIQIIGLIELIKLAKTIHVEAIKSLDHDLDDDDEDVDDVDGEEDPESMTDEAGVETDGPTPTGGASNDRADEVTPVSLEEADAAEANEGKDNAGADQQPVSEGTQAYDL